MGKLTDKIKKTFRNFWNSIPMSVYVALDENGNPVEMARGDGPTSPNMRGREQDDYKYFVRRLVKRYGRGDHIPDFQFVRFDFPNQ